MNQSALIARLGDAGVFAGLNRAALAALAEAAEPRRINAGQLLMRQDEPADAMYFVRSGTLEALRGGPNQTPLLLGTIGPGATVGEIQIMTRGPRTASVRAVTDADLLRWSCAAFEAVATAHPAIFQRVAAVIHARLRHDELLAALPRWLGELDVALRDDLEAAVTWVRVEAGEQLMTQGEPGESMYLCTSGQLVVTRRDAAGGERMVREMGRGASIGEVSLFSGEPRSVTVTARRASELARLTAPDFEGLVQRHPQLLTAVTRSLARELRGGVLPGEASPGLDIAVVPLCTDVPLAEFCRRLVAALRVTDAAVRIDARGIDARLGMAGAATLPDDSPHALRVEALLDQLQAEYDVLVHETDVEDSTWTRRALRRADLVLLVAHAADEAHLRPVERRLAAAAGTPMAVRQRLVLLHPPGAKLPAGTARWLDPRTVEMHHHVRWDRGADFGRLARLLSGRALGLALGGGGARGMAHIGVLRALRERGLPIDLIGGTSAGGIIATQHAQGFDATMLFDRNRTAFKLGKPFHDFTLPFVSLIGDRRMNRFARWIYGDAQMEDLWTPCFCTACNLSTGASITLRRGPVWRAVRATSALPGISPPVVERGELLVDGGVVDNLPGARVQALSGGQVIVVDVSVDEDLTVRATEMPGARALLANRLLRGRPRIAAPSIMDIIVRTAVIGSVKGRDEAHALAALSIRPPVEPFAMLEFSAFDQIVEVGYREALARLDAWFDASTWRARAQAARDAAAP